MSPRGAITALKSMAHDDDQNAFVTERFERRIGEECGQLRLDMTEQFGKVRTELATEHGKLRAEMVSELGKVRTEMAEGFGALRADMITRNADLLKWLLVFFTMQTAALAALLKLVR
jgi:hypothetical protein